MSPQINILILRAASPDLGSGVCAFQSCWYYLFARETIMRNRLKGTGAGFVMALAASTLTAAAQDGGLTDLHSKVRVGNKLCFADHYHYGTSGGLASKKAAEAEAIRSWAGFVAWEYGDAWASIKLAVSKNMSCSNSAGSWSCNLEARPCRRR
jgi:hypothetical protein